MKQLLMGLIRSAGTLTTGELFRELGVMVRTNCLAPPCPTFTELQDVMDALASDGLITADPPGVWKVIPKKPAVDAQKKLF